jgi:hypothetical protein
MAQSGKYNEPSTQNTSNQFEEVFWSSDLTMRSFPNNNPGATPVQQAGTTQRQGYVYTSVLLTERVYWLITSSNQSKPSSAMLESYLQESPNLAERLLQHAGNDQQKP